MCRLAGWQGVGVGAQQAGSPACWEPWHGAPACLPVLPIPHALQQICHIRTLTSGPLPACLALPSFFPCLCLQEVKLKFIDTASKFGNGRFQTAEEKARALGRIKA
jgi:hypothetical protein